jgi:hypothetical protein
MLNTRIRANHSHKIIMIVRSQHIRIQASSSHTDNYVATSLYILEQLTSWSTSGICPSCPRSRVRLNLLLTLFLRVYSCLLWPTQHLAVCSNSSHFALDLFLACWWPNTCTQVNNTLMLRHIHIHTHIYTTSALFILLLYTSSTPSGRLAALDPSHWAQIWP